VELASRALPRVPIVGVTGSNGKTTVTSLLGAIGAAAGLRVGVGGNIGTAASELALAGGWDAVILELSSFQLEGCTTLRPRVGVLLNVSPDHLDRHPTMASYLAAKARVFAHQLADDFAVLNADDPALAACRPSRQPTSLDASCRCHLVGDSLRSEAAAAPARRSCLLGDHQRRRALAAALAASRLGFPRRRCTRAAERDAPPHRHQLVAEAGVRWADTQRNQHRGHRRRTCRLRHDPPHPWRPRQVTGFELRSRRRAGSLAST
jgi:UDP-N-acetylmuramoylalanine--D-glutamate ligase